MMNRTWLALSLSVLSVGCSGLREAGREVGQGVMEGALEPFKVNDPKVAARNIGHELMDGVQDKAPETTHLVFERAGEELRQEVLNDATNRRVAITVDVASDRALQKIEGLTRALDKALVALGERGERLSRQMMREAGEGLEEGTLSEPTQDKLNALVGRLTGTARDQLLGRQSRDQILAIVKESMAQASGAVDVQREKLREDLAGVRTQLRRTLLGVAALVLLAVAVIAFILRERVKGQRLLQFLLLQIEGVQDEQARRDLKERIRMLATASGLEPQLRRLLTKQGLVDHAPSKPLQ